MARTQAAEYDQRRQKIVAAAAALFARHGFHAASIADIAKSCAMSKSLVYHYYASKEDILADVMASHVLALDEAARATAASKTNAEARLRTLLRAFMALYVGAEDRHKVLLNELDSLAAPRRAEIVALQRGLIAQVAEILVELQPELKRKRGAPRAAAMLVFGMINWTHTWYSAKGPIAPDDLADMAASLVIGGISSLIAPSTKK